jgi:hypothetical protein
VKLMPRLALVLIGFLAAALPGVCAAQTRAEPTLTLEVSSKTSAPYVVTIWTQPPGAAIRPEQISERVWQATRVKDGMRTTVTALECPALNTVVSTFSALPALSPRTAATTVYPVPLPLPPRRYDGDQIVVRFKAVAPDYSEVEIAASGGQGPYAEWASESVRALDAFGGGRVVKPPAPRP